MRIRGDFCMEYAKENLFEVRYDTKLDRLVIKKPRFRTKLLRAIKTHKIITTISIAFIMLSTFNFIMIFSFMKILQNI